MPPVPVMSACAYETHLADFPPASRGLLLSQAGFFARRVFNVLPTQDDVTIPSAQFRVGPAATVALSGASKPAWRKWQWLFAAESPEEDAGCGARALMTPDCVAPRRPMCGMAIGGGRAKAKSTGSWAAQASSRRRPQRDTGNCGIIRNGVVCRKVRGQNAEQVVGARGGTEQEQEPCCLQAVKGGPSHRTDARPASRLPPPQRCQGRKSASTVVKLCLAVVSSDTRQVGGRWDAESLERRVAPPRHSTRVPPSSRLGGQAGLAARAVAGGPLSCFFSPHLFVGLPRRTPRLGEERHGDVCHASSHVVHEGWHLV